MIPPVPGFRLAQCRGEFVSGRLVDPFDGDVDVFGRACLTSEDDDVPADGAVPNAEPIENPENPTPAVAKKRTRITESPFGCSGSGS